MTHHRSRLGRGILAAVFALLILLPGAARAQEMYTFTAGVLGGIGGSPDVELGDDLSNTGFQINLDMVTEPRTHVAIRLGQLGLDADEQFGSLTDADLSYVTLAGEYRFPHSFYESGLYVGLGGYRLEGSRGFRDEEDTSIGGVVGITGEFAVTRWLGVLVELSGHYVDFDEAQIFGMAHGGIAIHF